MARPERFELPTPWFVGRSRVFRIFRINKLDGPPSPNFTPRLAESRREQIQPYATALSRPFAFDPKLPFTGSNAAPATIFRGNPLARAMRAVSLRAISATNTPLFGVTGSCPKLVRT